MSRRPPKASPHTKRKARQRTHRTRGVKVLDGPFTTLMSVGDLSNYLNVSRSTIRRLYNSGQIPCVRVGSRVRFDALAVRAALDKKS